MSSLVVSWQRTLTIFSANVFTGWRISHKWLFESEPFVTTDGQSASLSFNKAPIWSLRPDFYHCQTDAGLLMWGALSDERTDLSFTVAAGLRQISHSRVRVLRDSRPYFTLSDPRLLFSSLPNCSSCTDYKISTLTEYKTPSSVAVHFLPWEHVCLRSHYSVTALVYLLIWWSLPSNRSTYCSIYTFCRNSSLCWTPIIRWRREFLKSPFRIKLDTIMSRTYKGLAWRIIVGSWLDLLDTHKT
jgi:hypothetical protein